MSGLYTRFVAGVVFPLQERLKHHSTVADLSALEASQWWDRSRILDLQLQRLRALLVHAGARVPYYRELFARCGFDPAAVRSVADLARLPLLDKPTIRAHTDALKAEGAVGLARFNTGGSSGEPLIFYIGRERVSRDVAAKWRATRWWGVDIGDPEVVVWGSPIELKAQDRMRGLRDALMRTELLSAFEMSPERLDHFVARIRARRPAMLFGYPSSLSMIAAHAAARGVRLDDLGVKVAFVTSERLYPEQRAAIERAFACPVANGYGGRDAGFIAHQCPAGSLHITAEDIVLETVDAEGRAVPAGQPGEIVVTHLATGEFPFIRYRTGDVGVLSDAACACGRGLPVLAEVQGRTTDFVVAADGTVMHGLALVYVLRDLPGVQHFRIVQESLALTRIELVATPAQDAARDAAVVAAFRRRLGAGVEVRIEPVEAIARERSGKYRYVQSRVAAGPALAASEPQNSHSTLNPS